MTRVAGSPRFFPLQSPLARRKLTETIRFYVSAYRCRMFAFEVLDNHYHLIVHFEKFRELTRLQLERAAAGLYGKRWKTKTKGWDWGRWLVFNRRRFDVSSMMQHINGGHCQRKVARTEFSTDDRELGRPELTPLGECGGAVELEIVS